MYFPIMLSAPVTCKPKSINTIKPWSLPPYLPYIYPDQALHICVFLSVNSCIICFFLLVSCISCRIYIFFFFFTFIIMLCLINRQGYLFQSPYSTPITILPPGFLDNLPPPPRPARVPPFSGDTESMLCVIIIN